MTTATNTDTRIQAIMTARDNMRNNAAHLEQSMSDGDDADNKLEAAMARLAAASK